MKPTELLDVMLKNTFDKTNISHRLKLTREFLEFYYYKDHEKQSLIYLLNQFVNQKGENRDDFNALFTWSYPFFDQLKKGNFYEMLKEIEKEADELPQVILYLPFYPLPYDLPKLCEWFRTNVNPRFIIDTRFDPQLIGGCALVYKGRYYDFSLRYYLEKNKQAIKEIIEDYLDK